MVGCLALAPPFGASRREASSYGAVENSATSPSSPSIALIFKLYFLLRINLEMSELEMSELEMSELEISKIGNV